MKGTHTVPLFIETQRE